MPCGSRGTYYLQQEYPSNMATPKFSNISSDGLAWGSTRGDHSSNGKDFIGYNSEVGLWTAKERIDEKHSGTTMQENARLVLGCYTSRPSKSFTVIPISEFWY